MKKRILSTLIAFTILLAACTEGGTATPGGSGDFRTEATTGEWQQTLHPDTTWAEDWTSGTADWTVPTTEPEIITCRHTHRPGLDFDDSTMTLHGVFDVNTVEWLLSEFRHYDFIYLNCFGIILENGVEVTEGYLEIGMTVQIYHDGELFGEYTIRELLPSFGESRNNSGDTSMSPDNSTMSTLNFVLPICGMVRSSQTRGNLGCGHGCELLHHSSRPHKGLDIGRGGIYQNGIYGTPIRAAEAGVVTAAGSSGTTMGVRVEINHGGGITTVYGHMHPMLRVSQGHSVVRGQIIGYVGNTNHTDAGGDVHLHLELRVNGGDVNPLRDSPSPNFSNAQSHNPNVGNPTLVVVDANEGRFRSSETSRSLRKTQDIDLPLPTPTRDDFIFLGWSTNRDDETPTIRRGQMYIAEEDTTLYAVWRPVNGWTYTWDGGGSVWYLRLNGDWVTGWHYDPQYGRWFYLDPNKDGLMAREWQWIQGDGWYYFNPVPNGWQGGLITWGEHHCEINDAVFYLDPNDGGRMARGWRRIGRNVYYFRHAANQPNAGVQGSRIEAVNDVWINGASRAFGAYGVCINPHIW
jgi:hypothetical protein